MQQYIRKCKDIKLLTAKKYNNTVKIVLGPKLFLNATDVIDFKRV